MKSIKKVWPIFLDKSRITWENRVEVGGMTETIGDFCDAIEADPDGFVELVRMTDSEGITFLMPFFEEITDLPDSTKRLIEIQEAIRQTGKVFIPRSGEGCEMENPPSDFEIGD